MQPHATRYVAREDQRLFNLFGWRSNDGKLLLRPTLKALRANFTPHPWNTSNAHRALCECSEQVSSYGKLGKITNWVS